MTATTPAPAYTAAELAQRAGVGEATIRKLARKGLIPGGFRVGSRTWRFARSVADAWLNAGGTTPAKAAPAG